MDDRFENPEMLDPSNALTKYYQRTTGSDRHCSQPRSAAIQAEVVERQRDTTHEESMHILRRFRRKDPIRAFFPGPNKYGRKGRIRCIACRQPRHKVYSLHPKRLT